MAFFHTIHFTKFKIQDKSNIYIQYDFCNKNHQYSDQRRCFSLKRRGFGRVLAKETISAWALLALQIAASAGQSVLYLG